MQASVLIHPSSFCLHPCILGDLLMREWSGWLWLGEHWWRACHAHTLADCAAKLSRAADEENVRDPDTILTRGGVPVGPPLGRVKVGS